MNDLKSMLLLLFCCRLIIHSLYSFCFFVHPAFAHLLLCCVLRGLYYCYCVYFLMMNSCSYTSAIYLCCFVYQCMQCCMRIVPLNLHYCPYTLCLTSTTLFSLLTHLKLLFIQISFSKYFEIWSF